MATFVLKLDKLKVDMITRYRVIIESSESCPRVVLRLSVKIKKKQHSDDPKVVSVSELHYVA